VFDWKLTRGLQEPYDGNKGGTQGVYKGIQRVTAGYGETSEEKAWENAHATYA
jgi:hypothetical protein